MTSTSLEARLAAHEAVVAERWIRVDDALTRLDRQITRLGERWWWLTVAVAGSAISAAGALLLDRLP